MKKYSVEEMMNWLLDNLVFILSVISMYQGKTDLAIYFILCAIFVLIQRRGKIDE